MNQEKKQKRVQPKKIEESLSYTVEVRDKEGRVLHRISAPSRSYVQQWNQLVNLQASQALKTIKDTGGVDRTPSPHALTLALAGYESSRGIVVGKGTTPVAIDDYALESQCVHGTGLDQFLHQPEKWNPPSVADSTCSFSLKRNLINNSGANITGIKEIGGYVSCNDGTYQYMLGFRDVLGSPVTVPDGGAITVEYIIGVTA